MIKLIAIDLDGTLLDHPTQISAANLSALEYAHSRGVKIVICTGRPYRSTEPVIRQLPWLNQDDYLITFNGGVIHRADTGEIVSEASLSQAEMLEWYAELERVGLPLNLIDMDYVWEPPSYPYPSFYVSQVTIAPSQVRDFSTFPTDHQFNKFVVCADEDYLDHRIARIRPELSDRYTLIKSHPYLLEIGNRAVNKGAGLIRVGERLQIDPCEMMALGDERNDLAMLELTGLGIAMGNAVDDVKAVADGVTLTNKEDGVAAAIYHYIQ